MKKKLIYLFLAVLILLPAAIYAYPDVHGQKETMPALQQYGQPFSFDPASGGIGMPYKGYYSGVLDVGGTPRTYKEYFPEGSVFNGYQVVITIPDNYNTEDFLVRSGWKCLSDKYHFTLFIMEPLLQKWGTSDSEFAYVKAAYAKRATASDGGNVNKVYIVGFDNGGQALQQVIMANALSVASAVFVNASQISSSYLASLSTLHYNDPAINAKTNPSDNSVFLNDVPVPVWIFDADMDADTQAVIAYWKGVNETVSRGLGFFGGKIYYQDKVKATANHFTLDGPVASVAVSKQKVRANDPNFSRTVYEHFLSLTLRYGSTAWSNSIYPRLDFKKLHVKNYSFVDQGVLREYMVYVPKHLKHSRKPLPVVYALPGGDTNQFTNFEISRLNEIADKYGWIVVSVAGAGTVNKASYLGTPANTGLTGNVIMKYLAFNDTGIYPPLTMLTGYVDDIVFFPRLMEQVEADYNVDAARRYIFAHSNGAAFALEMLRVMPNTFAAFGRLSQHLARNPSGLPTNFGQLDVPIYPIIGQNNGAAVNIGPIPANGTTLPSGGPFGTLSTGGTGLATALPLYLQYLGYSATDVATLVANPAINGAAEDLGNGMVRYTWEWQDASHVPIFRTSTTSLRGHSFIRPDALALAEWLTHWSRVNGKVVYEE